MFDVVLIEALATGYTLPDLLDCPVARVPQLAIASLSRRSEELEVALGLAIVPAAAIFGKTDAIDRLQIKIKGWRGIETVVAIDPREAAAIAALEEEMAREYPWYADRERLDKVWSAYGSIPKTGRII